MSVSSSPRVLVQKLILHYTTSSGRRSKKTIQLGGVKNLSLTAVYEVALPRTVEMPVGDLDKELVEKLLEETNQ